MSRPRKTIQNEEAVTSKEKRKLIKSPLPNSNVKRIKQEEDTFKVELSETPEKGNTSKRRGRRGNIEFVAVNNVSQDAQQVSCAICNAEMSENYWIVHKEKNHNNLAWKTGDPPLDLNDKSLITSLLQVMYKQKKKFKCETCSVIKKSVVGFLSHRDICNKSANEKESLKVKCNICDRKMLPVSLSSHMKLVHAPIQPETGDILNDGIRTKRKSAMRVTEVLKTMQDDDGDFVEQKKKSPTKPSILLNFSFQPTAAFKKRMKLEFKRFKTLKCKFNSCQYETNNMKDYMYHIGKCDKKININRTCSVCYVPFESIVVADEHFKQCQIDNEDMADEGFDNYDSMSDLMGLSYKKTSVVNGDRKYQLDLVQFIPRYTNASKTVYRSAFEWMCEFCSDNYNTPDLYKDIKPKPTKVLESDKIIDYLPLNKNSIEFDRTVENDFLDPQLNTKASYRRLKLFSSEIYNDGNSTVFCGGSISTIAWCPTPGDIICDQLIAVAVQLNPNDENIINQRYNGKGILQFWNFGPLVHADISKFLPKLEFCMAHDYGYIYDMEWCSSGCYDKYCLGLLGIACSDSYAYINAIKQPGVAKGKMFKLQPNIKLVLNLLDELNLGELNYQATKISWTKAKTHKYVAVGYSNGFVGLYEINLESTLCFLEENVWVLRPYRTICAHSHAITALSLFHMDEGCRWLMTGSTDRMNKFWDLKVPVEPICCHRRSNITDGVWPTNWTGGITSQDDGTVTIINSSSYGQMREVGVNPTAFLYANSTINSVAVCDWGNIFVHGTCNGEIHASYPNQIFQNVDLERSVRKKKFYIRQTALINKTLSTEERLNLENRKDKTFAIEVTRENFRKLDVGQVEANLLKEPLNYYEADKQYKMLFVDYNLENHEKITEEHRKNLGFKSKFLKRARSNQYSVQSVNKVTFNPNQQAFLYLASGYRAGLLTITCIRFLKKGLD